MYREPFCCPVCGGRGIVSYEFYEPDRKYYDRTELNFSTYHEMVPCRACNGTGYSLASKRKMGDNLLMIEINNKKKCLTCGGGGTIPIHKFGKEEARI